MKKSFFTTERVTGLLYLGLAITGMLAFLFARSKLYVEGDAVATATNLLTNPGLARFGVAAELGLVMFQALVAIWFFKLFRKVDSFASVSIMVLGSINAVLILIACAFWLNAVTTISTASTGSSEAVLLTQQMFTLHESLWVVGKLFFGLWLIPMGYAARKTHIPQPLGWILIAGGCGYVLSLFLEILTPSLSKSVLEIITVPATIGEFWMIGYLLSKRVKFTT